MNRYFVYILCSQKNGTLYVGSTSNLARRIYEHQQGLIPGFTKDYNIKILVHLEEYPTMGHAIKREDRLKNWNRLWKIELIEKNNPDWDDLSVGLLEELL